MRLRLGLILSAIVASLLSPVTPIAQAFGGYASAPSSVIQTAIAGGIRVGWSVPADVDTGITGYKVEYSTTGTSGTWTLATTTNSSTYSYDILGLPQVATYVRVAGTTSAGTGAYGYPWAMIYSTIALRRDLNGNVTYESGYGLSSLSGQASNTYASANYTRIKYRLQTTISSSTKFAEADFYTWPSGGATGSTSGTTAPSISGIAIPTVNTGQQWVVQANVSDMNVYSDNTAVAKAIGASGRLEIWPWDYGWGPSTISPAGSSDTYDYGDAQSGAGSYGSFQVHDLTNNKPVFIWNNTGYANGYTAEVAYGLNSGTNPDWTFCSQASTWGSCPLPSSFKLSISINPSIMPLADLVAPTVSRIDSKAYAKNGDTISVQSSELGTVYLVKNSVTVSNFASISGAASNQRSSVSISTVNTDTVLTTSGLQDGKYNLYAVDSSGNVSIPVSNTITMDSTPPTVTSIYLNTGGTTVFMNMSETVTHTSMGDTLYTISDGGPSNSVGSVGGTTTQLQLSVSRTIPAGATVNFAYTPSNGAASGRWVDLAGNELAAIALGPITNNSTAGVSVALTVPATIYKGVSLNISTVVNYPGKVTFLNAGKRIAGCIGKAASGAPPITVTCSYKASIRGDTTLSAIYTPSNSSIAGGVTPIVSRYILRRSNTR
jgi:hypothetical protein